ncbi:hypothetical protein D0C37_04185 [Streptomyces koyangensis]|uniref:Uncharacterized protein n=1 Tax=Streptomyces koyangensis TaxID=188770 RepID=A0A385D6E1_9ACTN|nr:hypothetical protein D0C37_04185 [Streptomyces koyangensis]
MAPCGDRGVLDALGAVVVVGVLGGLRPGEGRGARELGGQLQHELPEARVLDDVGLVAVEVVKGLPVGEAGKFGSKSRVSRPSSFR